MASHRGNTKLPSPQSASSSADQRDRPAEFSTLRKASSGHCREPHRHPLAGSHRPTPHCHGSCRCAGIDQHRNSNFHPHSEAGESRPRCGFHSEPPTLQPGQRYPSFESAIEFRISGQSRCSRSRGSRFDSAGGFCWHRAHRESRLWQPCARHGRSPRRSPMALPPLLQRWSARRDGDQHRHFIYLRRRHFHELPSQHPSHPLAFEYAKHGPFAPSDVSIGPSLRPA